MSLQASSEQQKEHPDVESLPCSSGRPGEIALQILILEGLLYSSRLHHLKIGTKKGVTAQDCVRLFIFSISFKVEALDLLTLMLPLQVMWIRTPQHSQKSLTLTLWTLTTSWPAQIMCTQSWITSSSQRWDRQEVLPVELASKETVQSVTHTSAVYSSLYTSVFPRTACRNL